jgi:hypothetical protein
MRVKLQLVMCSDDGHEDTITDLVTLQKDSQRIEHLGLTLREAKQLLTTIQHRMLQQQVEAFLASHVTCADCDAVLKVKGFHTRSFRTLFGTFKLASPRLFHCRCLRRKTTTFRPLTALYQIAFQNTEFYDGPRRPQHASTVFCLRGQVWERSAEFTSISL